MSNQMIPIGSLFEIEKGELQSTKCTPGEFDFITAAEDWKTHNEYTHECEALIFAAAASGSLGRTHYVDGKFTTSDLCYILTPKDTKKYPLNLSFYHFVFNSLRSAIVKATKSGTSKESINQTNFKKYEIPYFDIELQDLWIEKLKGTLGKKDLLDAELKHQQALLMKLRKQILKDAIEGKLTADWRAHNPDVEPASELIKRIAVKKMKLVKEKKIKTQNPLPPIKPQEKPFELPKGWAWCRLGELCDFITKGTTPSASELLKQGDIPYLKVYNIVNQKIDFDYKPQFIRNEVHEKLLSRSKIYPGDVLMNIVGPPLGKVALIPSNYSEWNINQALAVFRAIIPEMGLYIYYFLREGAPVRAVETKGVVGQDNISLTQCRELLLAAPSLPEQQAIVAKVEKLLAICDQLETQISQNQTHAEQLMRAVLKEAFNHNGMIKEAVHA